MRSTQSGVPKKAECNCTTAGCIIWADFIIAIQQGLEIKYALFPDSTRMTGNPENER
jgi:hypothetical protein